MVINPSELISKDFNSYSGIVEKTSLSIARGSSVGFATYLVDTNIPIPVYSEALISKSIFISDSSA